MSLREGEIRAGGAARGLNPRTVADTKKFKADLVSLLPALRVFARSVCHNATRADDLVQDTVVKALVNVDRFEPGTNFRAWLFTVLRNHYYSQLRLLKREVEDADGKHAARLAVRPEQNGNLDIEDMRAALSQLSTEHQQIIGLALEKRSYEEMAELLGIAVGTVKSRLNRGRDALRRALGETDREIELAFLSGSVRAPIATE